MAVDFPEELVKKVEPVRILILDVDGVMTDGSISYSDDGTEIKSFNVKDGHGIKLLKRCGIDCAVITSRSSAALVRRCGELGITHVYQGSLRKLEAYEDLLKRTGLDPLETAYVGDDLVDLPVLRRVGFSVAVNDAVEEVKQRVDYVTRAPGGRGAVREVVEVVLRIKGRWQDVMEPYEG